MIIDLFVELSSEVPSFFGSLAFYESIEIGKEKVKSFAKSISIRGFSTVLFRNRF